ncbi:hypothetical protein SAMN05444162_1806 [Paenibacillaceae bacterium GAS479]|nr:hypothetical protein SAMN05444162_1806 [Paenibacillaceae bacterium GAS479]
MRTGPKLLGLCLMVAGLLLGSAGWYFNQSSGNISYSSNSSGNMSSDAVNPPVAVPSQEENTLLGRLGLFLEGADVEHSVPPPPPGLSRIAKEQAIRNASWIYPKLEDSASSVSCDYRFITSNKFRSFSPEALAANPRLRESGKLNRTPVYIVTFKDVKVKDGLQGQQPPKLAPPGNDLLSEANIVVDALTGVTLLSYSFR